MAAGRQYSVEVTHYYLQYVSIHYTIISLAFRIVNDPFLPHGKCHLRLCRRTEFDVENVDCGVSRLFSNAHAVEILLRLLLRLAVCCGFTTWT